MKKLILLISLIFCYLFFCSGCTDLVAEPNLLSNPSFETKEYLIYNKLKKLNYNNSEISLVVPQNNKKMSSMTFYNNDKSVVLFYTAKNKNFEEKNVNMAIFTEKFNNWQYIADIPCDGDKLEYVFILKNKQENKEFLIVGSIKYDTKICSVYDLSNNSITKIYSIPYLYLVVGDVFGDGIESLITITKTKELVKTDEFTKKNELVFDKKYNIEIDEKIKKSITSQNTNKIKKEPHQFDAKITVLINKISSNNIKIIYSKTFGLPKSLLYTSSLDKATIDRKIFKKPCLILDISYNYGSDPYDTYYFSLLITFDDREYEKCENFQEKDFSWWYKNIISPSRSDFPVCIDIDKDQKLEYPINRCFPSFHVNKIIRNSDDEEWPLLTYWYKFSENIKEPFVKFERRFKSENGFDFFPINYIKQTYVDYTHKYGINIPEKWNDKNTSVIHSLITPKYINKNKDICFYIYKQKNDNKKENIENDEEKLLTIKVDRIDNKKEHIKKGFFIVSTDGQIAYFANIHENAKLSNKNFKLSQEDLKNMFFKIEE